MNYRILTTLVSFLLAAALHAQDDAQDEKSNGLRAGWHMSDFDGEEDADTRNGYYFGYYRNWFKVPLVSVSSGLELNTAGAVQEGSEFRLLYLTLPINGRLKLGPVYFDLGVDAALKVNEKWMFNGEELDIPSESKGESFDVLGHAGAGFKFLFLGVEVRYRHALTEVYEDYRNTGLEVGLITFFGN